MSLALSHHTARRLCGACPRQGLQGGARWSRASGAWRADHGPQRCLPHIPRLRIAPCAPLLAAAHLLPWRHSERPNDPWRSSLVVV